jgi:hypothetical protein
MSLVHKIRVLARFIYEVATDDPSPDAVPSCNESGLEEGSGR